jgi:hypothetical protein
LDKQQLSQAVEGELADEALDQEHEAGFTPERIQKFKDLAANP